MVVYNHVVEFLEQVITLFRLQFIDTLGETSDGIDTLPPRYRIGSYDRMDDGQVAAYVLWRSSRLLVQRGFPVLRRFDKTLADKRSRKLLEEFLVRFTKAVVDVIPGRP